MTDRDHDATGAGAWALADDAVLAAVKAQVLGEVQDPLMLGKYEIERPLGAGAMGRILLAHDPTLERRVALKIIAPQLADVPQARARIVQEARAMARLSDPNVAQVYEVARDGPHLFVAMEYVDGRRLRDWLEEKRRPWARIVDMFVQAGRGLAASHAKGLVHRDFKPDNVMLGRGGRAKVVDFGLACGLGEAVEQAELDAAMDSTGPQDPDVTATRTWLGTPAYMAPEQWEGLHVDARSDQFSFCVALYEALCGQRPFGGQTPAEVRAALHGSPVAPMRGTVAVPRRVEAAILRGLELDPRDRWPAMEPLLRALAPRSRAKTAIAVPTVALVLTVAAFSQGRDDPCADAGAPMDATWNEQVRGELSQALGEVDAVWAAPTVVAVQDHVDASVQAWRQAARAVCAADDAPVESTRCLDHARRSLAHDIDRLRNAGPAVLVAAASHMELLADPRACLQPTATGWLREHVADPDGPETMEVRQALSTAIRDLGMLSTAEGAQRYVDALRSGRAAAQQAWAGAEAIGERPLVAHAAWVSGRLALRDGDRAAAEHAFREAMDVAMEVGEPSLRAAATVELVYVVGNDRERTAQAVTLANEAEAMLGAQGDMPVWSARLLAHLASTLAHALPPQSERAVQLHREASEGLRAALGQDHPDAIIGLGNLGAALKETGHPADADAQLQDAIERARRVWGEQHPRTARLQGTLGLTRMNQGDLAGARELLASSLSVRAKALGQDHQEVASARYNLALVMRYQGDHAAAVEQLYRGLRVREAARGPDHIGHAEWLLRIGVSELAQGRVHEARGPLWRALELCERFGGSPDRFGNLRMALARAHVAEDPAMARVLAELALRGWARDEEERTNVEAFLAELANPAPAPDRTIDQ